LKIHILSIILALEALEFGPNEDGMSERPKHAVKDLKETKGHALDSREALLIAAQKVFAEKGFDGATVKDVADEAGVNISLISYHFGGKENLYRASLEEFALVRVELTERVLKPALSKEDFKLRLRLFAEEFLDIHLKEANICRMIHRGIDTMNHVSLDLFKSIFIRVFQALHNFLLEGQRLGLVRAELDAEITAGLMFGGLVNMIRSDQLRRHLGHRTFSEPGYREAVISQWVSQSTEGTFA
jgi:AcrR family transcriptional regulator